MLHIEALSVNYVQAMPVLVLVFMRPGGTLFSVGVKRSASQRARIGIIAVLAMVLGLFFAGVQQSSAQAAFVPQIRASAAMGCSDSGAQVKINLRFVYDNKTLKTQCVGQKKGEDLDWTPLLQPPEGYVPSHYSQWDFSAVDFYSDGLYEAVIPVTPAEYQVDVPFIFEGSEIGRQIFFPVLAGDVISEDQVSVPAGYKLVVPFSSYTVTGSETRPIEVERATYTVSVAYRAEEGWAGYQSFPDAAHGSLITEADLEIPAGYKIAAPFATHEVTGPARITVDVIRELYTVKVNFAENGVPVGSQVLSGLTRDAMISALDLVVPSGYKLVSGFADYVVVGDAEISVAVAKPVTDPDGEADPDGGEDPDGTIDPDTVTKPDVKPTTGTGTAATGTRAQLANTGDEEFSSALVLGVVLTALGLGASLVTRARRARNA